MFDAYTVKKVLPRLVIAAVLIQLSWDLFTGLVDVVNSIAWGIEGLLYVPFGGRDAVDITNIFVPPEEGSVYGTGLLAGIAAVGIGVALGVVGLLSLAATMFIALLIAFAVLALRVIVITALLVISPLALLAWILPNTEKFWKLWWESFSKLLLMYPLILLVIAAGKVFAAIAAGTASGSGDPILDTTGRDWVLMIVVVVAYFGPFFLIPKTFQLAGSTFANLTGMVNDRSRGVFDRLKKQRQDTVAKNWDKTKGGTRFTGNRVGRRFSRTLQTGTLLGQAGLNPGRMRANVANARDKITQQQRDALKEDEDYTSWMNNDTLNRAAAESTNANELRENLRRYGGYGNDTRALERDVARVEKVRKKYGTQALQQRAVVQAIAGGTAYDSAEEAWGAVARSTTGDTAARQALIAEGRSAAMSAGRVDIGGAGFGATMQYVDTLADASANHAAASAEHHQNVINSSGPGVLAHASMKPSAVRELAPQMRERVAAAYATGDQDQIERELATVASVYDNMAQNSPQNAQIFADEVLRWDPTQPAATRPLQPGQAGPVMQGHQQSLQQRIDAARGNETFQSTRREYQNAQQAALAGQGQPPPAPGAGPPGPPVQPPPGVSDIRLKTNVSALEYFENEIQLYSFRYIWSDTYYVGVMAQDIMNSHPEAVIHHDSGYYLVDYTKLGLKMVTLDEYNKNKDCIVVSDVRRKHTTTDSTARSS